MPTIISHAVVAAALVTAFPEAKVPRRVAVLGAACAMAPDLDVIGFRFGIQYGDLLGHRGLTHSILFAAILATLALWLATRLVRPLPHRGWVWSYLFLAAVSHGVLDAFTNGGRGVAFFAPFALTRYFFPVRPILVSPIGGSFFSPRGLAVLGSEVFWLWLPALGCVLLAIALRKSKRVNAG